MSRVSTAFSPGAGSVFHCWLMMFPSLSFSMSRRPLEP